MALRCVVCGDRLDADSGLVLATGGRRLAHCSEVCLEETVEKQMRARTVRRRWAAVGASVVALAARGRLDGEAAPRAPAARDLVRVAGDTREGTTRAERAAGSTGRRGRRRTRTGCSRSAGSSWTYPLPGPERRAPVRGRPVGSNSRRDSAASRAPAASAWAASSGANTSTRRWTASSIARRRGGNDDHGGGYVRIAHFGGMVFTHYFHLAAIPRGVRRGAHVAAGDVIGLVGDTGTREEETASRAHLHFAFSIRPSSEMAEVFWDPTPLMAHWLLRVPPHGTVAGLAVPVTDEDLLRRRRGR